MPNPCLEKADQVLSNLADSASLMDWDIESLRVGFDALVNAGLLCLKRPLEYGGPELSEIEFRQFQVKVARTSGALAFLQTQHQSAVGMINRSENQDLKDRYLKLMHGPKLVGIGFSQLRRSGEPLLQAVQTNDGLVLNGNIPWATGFEFFSEILIGASLPDGNSIFCIVPFGTLKSRTGEIICSERMSLAAMEACSTVIMDFDNWLVPYEQIVNILPKDWIHKNDELNVTLQGFFALGCAWAGYDIIESLLKSNPNQPAVTTFALRLKDALLKIEEELVNASTNGEQFNKAALRGKVIDLAFKSAQGAMVASRGAGISSNHPAQRINREALVFSVSAQTSVIQAATLERISFSS